MRRRFDEAAWRMLNRALELYRDNPSAAGWLKHHLERFDEPLRIAVAGPPGAGKSMLINALVGEEIAPVEVDGGGRVFTWYQDGPTPRATLRSARGSVRDLPITRVERRLRVDLPQWQATHDDLREVVVDWPTRTLRHMILIDTPPVGTVADDNSTTMDQIWQEADAVLYVTPNVPNVDLGLLRSGSSGTVTRAAPINTILVLSRADETGGGRIDALSSAKLIARRYHRNISVWEVCQTVIALSGLVAHAGRSLRESEFAALATMATRSRPELEDHLLSVDRFVGADFPVPVSAQTRGELIERFGLFGIRLATTLIRTGSATHSALSAQLTQRSGLFDLRESISQLFVDRRHVLKARSALAALESVVRVEPRSGAKRLVGDLERALASAHDLAELRLLAALRANRVTLPGDGDEEARRLIGACGTGAVARLGVDDDSGGSHAWSLATDAARRWREQAENPLFTQEQRRAALTVARSCEGILADLAREELTI